MGKSDFALVLGGGAARGFAHIGVIQAIEEKGLKPDLVVGTSVGALIGGVYARLGRADAVYRHFDTYIQSDEYDSELYERFVHLDMRQDDNFFSQVKSFFLKSITYGRTLVSRSIISLEDYARAIEALVPDVRIEDLAIPFACVAADLTSGDEILITRGSLRRAVMASCAIPGVYEPVPEKDMLLIDGGWVDKTPVPAALALGAEKIMAVNVSRELQAINELGTAVEIILRANTVSTSRLDRLQMMGADVCIEPELADVHWMDFSSLNRIVERGYQAAEKAMPDIVRHLGGRPWYRIFGRSEPFRPLWPEWLPPRQITMSELALEDKSPDNPSPEEK